MTKVFVVADKSCEYKKGTALSLKHALSRRMTDLQKAALEPLSIFQNESPENFKKIFHDAKCPIYFATAYGELDSNLKIAEDIYRKELPVSPLAFQHSVHNCVPGYFSIISKLHNSALTVSSGFISFDLALYWAWQKLESRFENVIGVVAADENKHAKDDHSTYAEIVILASEDFVKENSFPVKWEVFFSGSDQIEDVFDRSLKKQLFYEEETKLFQPPLRLSEYRYSFLRQVRDCEGKIFTSFWNCLL